MKITSICQLDGKVYTMDFPNMSEALYEAAVKMWEEGALIQDAFYFLNADQREFLMTGTPPQVWDAMFGGNSREDYDADDLAASDRNNRCYGNCD